MSNIKQLRAITQSCLVEPPIYRPFRLISVYVTLLLLRTPVTPNQITLLWAASLCVAAWIVGTSPANTVSAAIFVAIYYVLDCVDGELARARGVGSKLGSQLEQTCHWVSNGVILAGIAVGQFTQDGNHLRVLLWAVAVLIGDYAFHFTYYQLNLLFDRTLDYGLLHLLTRILYLLMPINTNVLLLTLPFGLQWWALMFWAVLSNVSWAVAFFLYYLVESRQKISLAVDVDSPTEDVRPGDRI